MADNPAGQRLELSVAKRAFSGSADNVTVQGLIIEKICSAPARWSYPA